MTRTQLQKLIKQKLSIRQIAQQIGKSPTTVIWWLRKYSLKTCAPGGRHAYREYRGKCLWHTCKNRIVGKRFCSRKCENKYNVSKRRKQIKEKAVAYLGGMCIICGYSKYVGALEPHHLNPRKKKFSISRAGHSRAWARVQKELDKCVLLCCRCHAEVHGGVAVLPNK